MRNLEDAHAPIALDCLAVPCRDVEDNEMYLYLSDVDKTKRTQAHDFLDR